MKRFGKVQPLDETGLTHQQNFLQCVAVLCLYTGGSVILCDNGRQFAHNNNNNNNNNSDVSKRSFSNEP